MEVVPQTATVWHHCACQSYNWWMSLFCCYFTRTDHHAVMVVYVSWMLNWMLCIFLCDGCTMVCKQRLLRRDYFMCEWKCQLYAIIIEIKTSLWNQYGGVIDASFNTNTRCQIIFKSIYNSMFSMVAWLISLGFCGVVGRIFIM